MSNDNPLSLRRLFTLGPAPADHGIAIRCALGVFLPMAALLLLDRLDLSVFAVFAASPTSTAASPGTSTG